MKKHMKSVWVVFFFIHTLWCGTRLVTPTIVIRSQSFDSALGLVGSIDHSLDSIGTLACTPIYSHTLRERHITECLFGDDVQRGTEIHIQGSGFNNQIRSRDPQAWLADYFYLPPDFDGVIRFDPEIHNVGIGIYGKLDLGNVFESLYVDVLMPIVYSRQTLGLSEEVTTRGSRGYSAGYLTPDEIPVEDLLQSFESYIRGDRLDVKDDVTLQELRFEKIVKETRAKTGIADIRASLGFDVMTDVDFHIGAAIKVAAPAGNRGSAIVFDVIIGNGDFWELGIELNGHYILWHDEDYRQECSFYGSITAMHFFERTFMRTFDLKDKPVSRYMLAHKLGLEVSDCLQGTEMAGSADGVTPVAQFVQEVAPVANLTTVAVRVSNAVQVDVVGMLHYKREQWAYDIGYELWARNGERITRDTAQPSALTDGRTWALKGDARLFGFAQAASEPITQNKPIALSATQQEATINNGLNRSELLNNPNERIDNPQFATVLGNNIDAQRVALTMIPGQAEPQIRTSIQPVFLSEETIDLGQCTRGMSQRVFGHISYTWDKDALRPYFGIGASIELGPRRGSNERTGSDMCINCTPSYWAFWLKGGLSFG